MASAEKGKYVVLFTSGNFVFFKHKNDKGIFCPKSILNSYRKPEKDDIYELSCESVTQLHHNLHPYMPEGAVLIATKAKFLKTPRVIKGEGIMKKISQDGEYGFVEYQDDAIGKTPITAFCTRITVKPQIDKGGMHKFFAAGGRVRFVAKEQPPSGMFNIEWRVVTATDMRHEISDTNYEKVTPICEVIGSLPIARPVSVATAASSTSASVLVGTSPPRVPLASRHDDDDVVEVESSEMVCPSPSIGEENEYSSVPDIVPVSAYDTPAEMVHDMFHYMRMREENFPALFEVEDELKSIIDWAFFLVTKDDECEKETLHLTMSLVHRCHLYSDFIGSRLFLVVTASFLIAFKFVENERPDMRYIRFFGRNHYSNADIFQMEAKILDILRFDVSIPTVEWFVSHMLNTTKPDKDTIHLAHYLCDLSLLMTSLHGIRPSVVAASCLALSNLMTGPAAWSQEMENTTGIQLNQLERSMTVLLDAFKAASQAEPTRMFQAYSRDRFEGVALMDSPAVLPPIH